MPDNNEIISKLAVLESKIEGVKESHAKIDKSLPKVYSRIEDVSKEIFIVSGKLNTCIATHGVKGDQYASEIIELKKDIAELQESEKDTEVFKGRVKLLYPILLIILQIIFFVGTKFIK